MKYIIIVESSGKTSTIQKILNSLPDTYDVRSCGGHIYKTDNSKFDQMIENRNLSYQLKNGSSTKKFLSFLKKQIKRGYQIILATDLDREGEAIAWSLADALKLSLNEKNRITFNEITKDKILKALNNKRTIDINLVKAQKSRSLIDLILGFKSSGYLKTHLGQGYSSGRVQSVALKLVCDREKEIKKEIENIKFKFYTHANFLIDKKEIKDFKMVDQNKKIKKLEKDQILEIMDEIEDHWKLEIENLGKHFQKPQKPFITSSLLVSINKKLGLDTKTTMKIAQTLYEKGLITYMRTDSYNISDDFKKEAKNYIIDNYSKKYVNIDRKYRSSKSSQEAHEAIRPTSLTNKKNIDQLTDLQRDFYNIIWSRTLESLMSDAEYQKRHLLIKNELSNFLKEDSSLIFEGFQIIQKKFNKSHEFLKINNNTNDIKLNKMLSKQKPDTSIKKRFDDGSLVKELEKREIGRPSTYSKMVEIIQNRKYVETVNHYPKTFELQTIQLKNDKQKMKTITKKLFGDKKKFSPTNDGNKVNQLLEKSYQNYINYDFTKELEDQFEKIAKSEIVDKKFLDDFIKKFLEKEKKLNFGNHNSSYQNNMEQFKYDDEHIIKKIYSKRTNKYFLLYQNLDAKIGKSIWYQLSGKKEYDDMTRERAILLIDEKKKYPLKLGTYKDTDVLINVGKFGPYIIYGDKKISCESKDISFEKAKNIINGNVLFQYKGSDVALRNGKYGKYLKWNDQFINSDKLQIPDSKITLELFKEILEDNKVEVLFNYKGEDVILKNGKFGSYLQWGKINRSINDDRILEDNEEIKKLLEIKIFKRDLKHGGNTYKIRKNKKGNFYCLKITKSGKKTYANISSQEIAENILVEELKSYPFKAKSKN